VVERCIAWLKESRRLATRHEKLEVNLLRMIKQTLLQPPRFSGQSLVIADDFTATAGA